MKGYELSPEATDDLQEIWVYIANDNPIAADKLEDDIYAACELLAKNPLKVRIRFNTLFRK